MPSEKNNITVLVAPLDWGLGHATRCIPVIRVLINNHCRVIIATSGHHQALLQTEFPDLTFLTLSGYGIRYGKVNVLLRLLLQSPLFFRNIKQEYQWLQQAIDEHKIDAVISDNRYGLHSTRVPCVFITHQLQVQSPALFKWTENGVRKRLYRFIEKFNTCWVPDIEDITNSLGNVLSHPAHLPATPVHYIGWLTRFSPLPVQKKKYKLLISLSGPEPQRTLLEAFVIPQLKEIKGQVLLVRGLPGPDAVLETGSIPIIPANVTIISHLPGMELQKAIAETEFFLSRCGYSTLMDLQAVACRCIFVPTPGQTEQEYLGRKIAASGKAVVVKSQKQINLLQSLQEAAALPLFSNGDYHNHDLEKIIIAWMNTIRTA